MGTENAVEYNVILPDDPDQAREKLQQILLSLETATVVVLGEEYEDAFSSICSNAGGFSVVVVWAKNLNTVKEVLDQLAGSEVIRYGPLGTPVISINYHDRVTYTLSRRDANNPHKTDEGRYNGECRMKEKTLTIRYWAVLLLMLCYVPGIAIDEGSSVKSVKLTPSLKQIGKSRIIDTKEGFLVELDVFRLTEALLTAAEKSEMSAKLHVVATLDLLASEGLSQAARSLDLAASIPGRLDKAQSMQVLGPLNTMLGRLDEALDTPANAAIYERMNEAIKAVPSIRTGKGLSGEPDDQTLLPRKVIAALNEIRLYVMETRLQIADLSIRAQTELSHQRDNDRSRRSEIAFLTPLTKEDKDVWNKLKNDWANSNNGDPEVLKKQLIEQSKGSAIKVAGELAKYLEEKTKELENNWQTLAEKLKHKESKVEQLRVKYEKLAKELKSLSEQVDDFVQFVKKSYAPESDSTDIVLDFSSKASAIAQKVESVVSAISDLGSNIGKALADIGLSEEEIRILTGVYKDAGACLHEFMLTVDAKLSSLPREILSVYGLASQMVEIGKMATDLSNDAVVRYDNNDGYLVSGPSGNQSTLSQRLVSGDELLFTVTAKKTGVPMVSERFYVFKQGWRTDRLFSLAFIQRDDTDAWKFYPTVSDVFKHGNRSSVDANRLLSFGLGLSVTMLDQDNDDQQELGIAPTLTLLDDRLLIGVGLNLTTNKSYFFVGYRLPVRM